MVILMSKSENEILEKKTRTSFPPNVLTIQEPDMNHSLLPQLLYLVYFSNICVVFDSNHHWVDPGAHIDGAPEGSDLFFHFHTHM